MGMRAGSVIKKGLRDAMVDCRAERTGDAARGVSGE